jgi:hypothetical protein
MTFAIVIAPAPAGILRHQEVGARARPLAIEKPIASAQATSSLVNVVPFRKPAPRRANLKLVAPVNAGDSWTEAIAPLSAIANAATNNGSGRLISDFVHVGRRGPAKATPKSVTHGDEIHLTPIDVILTTLLFLSTLTGPALISQEASLHNRAPCLPSNSCPQTIHSRIIAHLAG